MEPIPFPGPCGDRAVPDHVFKALQSPGRPIGSKCRTIMERAFGAELGHVRIHNNTAAGISADVLGARAYTVANHIVFTRGQYNWRDCGGKRLLAHELVHVLQQNKVMPAVQGPLSFGCEDDSFEEQAREVENLALWDEAPAARAWQMPTIEPCCDVALYRATSKVCVAPNDALALILGGPALGAVNRLVGLLADGLITLDYLALRPGRILVDHYLDNPFTETLVIFLVQHNRKLRNPVTLISLAMDLTTDLFGLKRPDILTDMSGVRELYEIKPDSISGLADGKIKLALIDAFLTSYGLLHYARGATFTPTASIPIASGTIPMFVGGPLPFDMTLSVLRTMPGLIQYEVCVETDWAKLGVNALVMIAIIIVVLVAPKFLPLPSPVPVPVF